MTTATAETTAGGIGNVPRKASWIIAMMARPIATNLVVVVEFGMAVAAAAAAKAEAVGTATEKNERRGNT